MGFTHDVSTIHVHLNTSSINQTFVVIVYIATLILFDAATLVAVNAATLFIVVSAATFVIVIVNVINTAILLSKMLMLSLS